MVITTTSLPAGIISRQYTALLSASGGLSPYQWSVSGGTFPAGIRLDPFTGRIDGIPAQNGQFTLILQVKDALGAVGTKTFGLFISAVALDPYGGILSKPSPNGATGYWHLEKFGKRWMWVTPDGNAFWMIDTYTVDPLGGSPYYTRIIQKYGSATVWGQQAARRLLAHGFNSVGPNSSPYVKAWSVTAPDQVPSFFIMDAAADAFGLEPAFNGQVLPPDPPKDLVTCQDRMNGYNGWAGSETVDAYDPSYLAYLNGELAAMLQTSYDGPNLTSPWAMAFVVDDRDQLFGFGPGPDIPNPDGVVHPHLGWMALAATPNKPARNPRDLLYKNPTVYSKRRIVRFLEARYRTISALNAAWNSNYTAFHSTATSYSGESLGASNGSALTFNHVLLHLPVTPGSVFVRVNGVEVAADNARPDRPALVGSALAGLGTINYNTGEISLTFSSPLPPGAILTVSYSAGGWGSGTGLMDENGRHTAWLGPRDGTLTGVSSTVQKDLDDFLYAWASHYFRETTRAVKKYAPHMLVASTDAMDGDGGIARKPILLAAAKYNDFLDVEDTNSKQILDLMTQWVGDVPIMSVEFDAANPDSPNSANRTIAAGTLAAATQAVRGQLYAKELNFLLNYTSPAGNQPVIGMGHFDWADGCTDSTNWGLVTCGLDNLYDGREAVSAQGTDPWGFPTGGESANYGDYLTPVTNANFSAISQLASGH